MTVKPPEIEPPQYLSGAARDWFLSMLDAYIGFELEPAAVSGLTNAAIQLQRAGEYRAAVELHGVVVTDRFGSLKENPACAGERAAWNLHRLACRDLGLKPANDDDLRVPRVTYDKEAS